MTAMATCWREAVANLLATPYRFALLAVVLATTMSYVGLREAATVHDLAGQAVQLRLDGRGIVVVTGRSSAVPGAACERLSGFRGVRAAGVLHADGQVVVPTNPQSAYDSFTASSGMAHLLTIRATTTPVVVGGAMARELGLADGASLRTAGAVRPVAVLRELGARTELVDRGVVTLVPAASVAGSCYVELESGGADAAATWLPAVLGMPRDQLLVTPLLAGASAEELPGPAPDSLYRDRASRYDWLVLPLVPLMVWLLLTRSRRTELALYSLSGARPAQVALVLWLEWLGVAVVVAVVAVAAVALGAHRDGPAAAAGLRATALSAAVSLAAVLVAAVGTGFRRRGEYDLLRSSR